MGNGCDPVTNGADWELAGDRGDSGSNRGEWDCSGNRGESVPLGDGSDRSTTGNRVDSAE